MSALALHVMEEASSDNTHWVIGGIALGILLLLMLGLLAFGAGREHS